MELIKTMLIKELDEARIGDKETIKHGRKLGYLILSYISFSVFNKFMIQYYIIYFKYHLISFHLI